MLREYQLTNFKAFAGSETIPLRPITLIYGPNSSGKSSLLQSLLLLKQTLQEAENPETLLLPKGNLVNLGSYREFAHCHDVSKPFSFKVILDVEKQGTLNPFGNLVPDKLIETPLLGLRVTFTYDEQTSNVVFSSVELFIGDDSSPAVIYKPEKRNIHKVEDSSSSATILKLDNINYEHSLWQAWWKESGNLFSDYRETEVSKIFQALEFQSGRKGWQKRLPTELFTIEKALKEKLQKLDEKHYLYKSNVEKLRYVELLIRLWQHFDDYKLEKAIKDIPQVIQYSFLSSKNFLPLKTIPVSAEKSSKFWGLSEIYKHCWKPDFSELTLLSCSTFRRFLDSTIYIGPLRDYPERLYILSGNSSQQVGKSGKMVSDILFRNPELLKQVNAQLERFGLGYELKVASYTNYETSELSDVFALRLIDKYTGVNVSLLDVGFGISQVLPIIVQSMLSRNSTLLIEQPEIHIHPRLQAELGSLVAECIKSPFNNQFIIETHSEHLMLRLQKLIRKGELKPEDVSVIYVNRDTEGSKCLHIRIDEEGDFIDEWPDGFFEEDFNEIFQ